MDGQRGRVSVEDGTTRTVEVPTRLGSGGPRHSMETFTEPKAVIPNLD